MRNVTGYLSSERADAAFVRLLQEPEERAAWIASKDADHWWESLTYPERHRIAEENARPAGMDNTRWFYGLTSDQAVRIWRAQTQGAEK